MQVKSIAFCNTFDLHYATICTLGKLFTRVLNNRLGEWAETYSVLIEAQAGFRPGMSTVDNNFVFHGLITHMLNSSKNYIVLL